MTNGAKWKKLFSAYDKAFHEGLKMFAEDETGHFNMTEFVHEQILETFYDIVYDDYAKKLKLKNKK